MKSFFCFIQNPFKVESGFQLESGVVQDMTVMQSGEVVEYASLYPREISVLRWYSIEGNVKHLIPRPAECQHDVPTGSILSLDMSNGEHIALSCYECQVIWLWATDSQIWTVSWKAQYNVDREDSIWTRAQKAMKNVASAFEKRQRQFKPWKMCHGGSGRILVLNAVSGDNMTLLDTTRVPFRIVQQDMGLQWQVNKYARLAGFNIWQEASNMKVLLGIIDNSLNLRLCEEHYSFRIYTSILSITNQ